MLRKGFLIIAISICCLASVFAQGAHDLLVRITQDRAASISSELGLTDEAPEKLKNIYVRYAVAVEDIIVNADPDVSVIDKIEFLERSRDELVERILDDQQIDLYRHHLEEFKLQQRSEFDSLQVYLSNDSFKLATEAYYDENVAPYILFYHQSYFNPALKQKHLWKINQARADIRTYVDGLDSTGSVNIDKSLNTLKKIRRRYKDQLDYITVALGPQERQWTLDYIALVRSHFNDEVYQKIADHTWSMNAYGMHYIVGELSMVLFDAWDPRSYIDNRESLLGLLAKHID